MMTPQTPDPRLYPKLRVGISTKHFEIPYHAIASIDKAAGHITLVNGFTVCPDPEEWQDVLKQYRACEERALRRE